MKCIASATELCNRAPELYATPHLQGPLEISARPTVWLVVARSLPGPTGLRNGTLSAASRSETLRNGTIQRSACFLNARNRLYMLRAL